MPVTCFVMIEDKDTEPRTLSFAIPPAVGDRLSIPGRDHVYIVKKIRHSPADADGAHDPTVLVTVDKKGD